MVDSVPIPYIRIWCNKNQLWVGFQTPQGDLYRVDAQGVYLTLPDRTLSLVNPRLIFPVIDRYPSLTQEELLTPPNSRFIGLNAYNKDDTVPAKRFSFGQIRQEVESYLSMLTHLDPLQFYVAVRAYESGVVGLPHLNRIAGNLSPKTTMGTELLQQRMCTWEDLLAVCLDMPRTGQIGQGAPAEYEMVGEIMVAIGRLTRTELQKALNLKRGGDKPLGEILMQMGACSKTDIDTCLQAQDKVRSTVEDRVGLLGELLVQQGTVTYEDLDQALRIQRMGRQPLPAVLVSMGVCSREQILEFRNRYPQYANGDDIDEKALAQYLVYHSLANERQLDEARRVQARGRMVLGELLVDLQKCTEQDIARLLGRQQSMRSELRNMTPDKFGDILIKNNVVQPDTVEEAARIQQMSRQKMGATLVSLGTCSQSDFSDALQLQFNWREQNKNSADKLGDQLLLNGEIDESNLQRALDMHSRAGKPLGQVLVESGTCSPESVINILIKRDERRRFSFHDYLKQNMAISKPQQRQTQPESARSSAQNGEGKSSIVEKISAFFRKPTQP
jgi:hypothetical protein